MNRIIVIGHGGYAEGIRKNLEMIVGKPSNMYFLDLHKDEDLSMLESKVNTLVSKLENDNILFACDLLGASPFRVAAMQCLQKPNQYIAVTGLNTMAFIELSIDCELEINEIADRALETSKQALAKFPRD